MKWFVVGLFSVCSWNGGFCEEASPTNVVSKAEKWTSTNSVSSTNGVSGVEGSVQKTNSRPRTLAEAIETKNIRDPSMSQLLESLKKQEVAVNESSYQGFNPWMGPGTYYHYHQKSKDSNWGLQFHMYYSEFPPSFQPRYYWPYYGRYWPYQGPCETPELKK